MESENKKLEEDMEDLDSEYTDICEVLELTNVEKESFKS